MLSMNDRNAAACDAIFFFSKVLDNSVANTFEDLIQFL